MSLPLRLTADLTRAKLAGSFGLRRSFPWLTRISANCAVELASAATAEKDRRELLQDAEDGDGSLLNRSRYLWIAGDEPLEHPDVAMAVNALAGGKHHVFLETCGASLKPRIHEFRPASRFYFVVRVEGRQSAPAMAGVNGDLCSIALEAIRMARLAGFYTFARLVYRVESPVTELESLYQQICKIGTDAVFLTPAAIKATRSEEFVRLRERLLHYQARWFSQHLEESEHPLRQHDLCATPRRVASESGPEDLEQGAEAQ